MTITKRTAPHRSLLLDDPATGRLIATIGLVSAALSLSVFLTNLLTGNAVRPAPGLGVIASLAVVVLARTDRLRGAALVLCWGLVGVGALAPYTTHGLFHPAWGLCAVGAMAGGWLFGRRMAYALAVTGSILALALLVLEKSGHTVPPAASHEVAIAAILATIWLSTIIGRWTADSLVDQRVRRAEEARGRLAVANESLRVSEAQMRSVLNTMAVGVIVIDNSAGAPLFVNEAFCAMLGLSRDEAMALRPRDVFPPEEIDALQERMRQASVGSLPFDTGVPLRHREGRYLITEIRSTCGVSRG